MDEVVVVVVVYSEPVQVLDGVWQLMSAWWSWSVKNCSMGEEERAASIVLICVWLNLLMISRVWRTFPVKFIPMRWTWWILCCCLPMLMLVYLWRRRGRGV